ncbi:MAG TPA: YifB family Mg chelatase-like AAA ATPase [Chloroflexota bacterium]
MLAKVLTCAVVGLDGALVEVEVDVGPGLPRFHVVGLPDAAIQEARERVRAAIRNSGLSFPLRRVTVSLAPAVLRKEGPAYDLPIAVGVLRASAQLPPEPLAGAVFLGELALDGALRHTPGLLPMVIVAREAGVGRAFVPAADAHEAGLVGGVEVVAVPTLADLVNRLRGDAPAEPARPEDTRPPAAPPAGAAPARLAPGSNGRGPAGLVDLAHVRGQAAVKRALEVAAAGGHNLLMVGPPGAGKTLVARALPGILPPLSPAEALEVTRIYSVAGLLERDRPLVTRRPFRAPHHTTSQAGMVGGGQRGVRPGEITLAHRGVLFLDELPEFSPALLEALRQPMEDGTISIGRAHGTVSYPAKAMVVGAMNPCPCGYLGDPTRACTCPEAGVTRYARRISGPILDRIDLHVEVPRVDYAELAGEATGEPSAAVALRVIAARERQAARLEGTGLVVNAEMGPAAVEQHCRLDEAGRALLRRATAQLGLTARGYHRVLKLARTIADLAACEPIELAHLAEALQYRARGSIARVEA